MEVEVLEDQELAVEQEPSWFLLCNLLLHGLVCRMSGMRVVHKDNRALGTDTLAFRELGVMLDKVGNTLAPSTAWMNAGSGRKQIKT